MTSHFLRLQSRVYDEAGGSTYKGYCLGGLYRCVLSFCFVLYCIVHTATTGVTRKDQTAKSCETLTTIFCLKPAAAAGWLLEQLVHTALCSLGWRLLAPPLLLLLLCICRCCCKASRVAVEVASSVRHLVSGLCHGWETRLCRELYCLSVI